MTDRTLHVQAFPDLFASPPAPRYRTVTSESLALPMRDGVPIAIDVILPEGVAAGERLPTLMIMARYWRSMALIFPNPPGKPPIGPREEAVGYFASLGYAVVVVDARGTGASGGVWRTVWGADERADYAEVARWIGAQPWSDGRIGAYGISYEGTTALLTASLGLAGVRGVIPQEIEFDLYTDVALPGGILNKAFIHAWDASNRRLDSGRTSSLFPPLARLVITGPRPVDGDREALRRAIAGHSANLDVYSAIERITFREDLFDGDGGTLDDASVFSRRAAIEASGTPLFTWGSWLDGATANAVLHMLSAFSNPQIAVIGAWKHEMTAHGSPFLPPNSPPDPPQKRRWAMMAGFFEAALSEEGAIAGRTLYYTTLGEPGWKTGHSFPPPEARAETWYFAPDRALSPDAPTEAGGADCYRVDFATTTGTTNRWHTPMAQPVIYRDRAKADARLLTYTSAPLTADMEITGYPVLHLYLASTHADGAFFVYLEDVDPDGVVRYLTEGELRGLHRALNPDGVPYPSAMPPHSFRRADSAPLPIAQLVELVIGLQPISALVRRGHRVRVALAGADADTFARIPEQGIPDWRVSRAPDAASHIILPVVPR